jgi:hypothetical protein
MSPRVRVPVLWNTTVVIVLVRPAPPIRSRRGLERLIEQPLEAGAGDLPDDPGLDITGRVEHQCVGDGGRDDAAEGQLDGGGRVGQAGIADAVAALEGDCGRPGIADVNAGEPDARAW